MYIFKQGMKVLKDEGVSALVTRISQKANPKPVAAHLHVFGLEDLKNARIERPTIGVEIGEIKKADDEAIDELTKIDEWRIPRSVTVSDLDRGWHCYVGRHAGRIVASVWAFLGREFEDWHLERTFILSSEETYFYRCSCLAAFRGKGILPYVWGYTCRDILPGLGKTAAFSFTRRRNKPMFRGYEKMGWHRLGRVGMIEMFSLRFHYLWGHRAFKETRTRFFIRKAKTAA